MDYKIYEIGEYTRILTSDDEIVEGCAVRHADVHSVKQALYPTKEEATKDLSRFTSVVEPLEGAQQGTFKVTEYAVAEVRHV